jgi:hypothetical protein
MQNIFAGKLQLKKKFISLYHQSNYAMGKLNNYDKDSNRF